MTKGEMKSGQVPIHQWTNGGDKVLIVRFVNDDGTSYNGFQWPESGAVEAPDFNDKQECGGGLHGWPWGLSIGDGKEPDYGKRWLVFATDPKDVVDLGGKVKAKCGEVVCYGSWHECLGFVHPGLAKWTEAMARGAASNSGYRGAASNSGDCGAASNSGCSGAASNSGDWGAASNSGDWGAASNSGYRGAASNSGDCGAASNSGYRGAASNSGDWGAASNSGYRGAASNSGYRGAASNSGYWGAAITTGNKSTIELSSLCVGCAITRKVDGDKQIIYWRVHIGAVLLVGWENEDGGLSTRTFDSAQMQVSEGDKLTIECGEIVNIDNVKY